MAGEKGRPEKDLASSTALCAMNFVCVGPVSMPGLLDTRLRVAFPAHLPQLPPELECVHPRSYLRTSVRPVQNVNKATTLSSQELLYNYGDTSVNLPHHLTMHSYTRLSSYATCETRAPRLNAEHAQLCDVCLYFLYSCL
jgi:hypothetical protein